MPECLPAWIRWRGLPSLNPFLIIQSDVFCLVPSLRNQWRPWALNPALCSQAPDWPTWGDRRGARSHSASFLSPRAAILKRLHASVSLSVACGRWSACWSGLGGHLKEGTVPIPLINQRLASPVPENDSCVFAYKQHLDSHASLNHEMDLKRPNQCVLYGFCFWVGLCFYFCFLSPLNT